MPAKDHRHSEARKVATRRSAHRATQDAGMPVPQMHPAAIVQQARHDPRSLEPHSVLQFQSAIGNQAMRGLLAGSEQCRAAETRPAGASISTAGRLDVVQMAPLPLFAGSEILYDDATHILSYHRSSKRVPAADRTTLVQAITTMLGLHTDAQSVEKQLRKYFSGIHMLLDFSLVLKQWTQMANHLGVVDARRLADEAQLRRAGLLARHDTFAAYELTGADPHKGGEATLMLRYATADGKLKKIVYKPADLTPERVLYAGGEFRVQQFGGTYAAPGGGGVAGVYGYMSFLQETGPQTPQHVASIYRSLGEGLAVAYVYGLRDLHHENFILFQDRIQWIDLEAMTGTFDDYQRTDMASLFPEVANKMLATLKETTEPDSWWFRSWQRRRNRQDLATRLGAVDVSNQIRAGFLAKKAALPAAATQAAAWATRFVPFPTRVLYDLVNLWHDKAELDAARFPPLAWAAGHQPPWYTNRLTDLIASYTGPAAEVRDMVHAPNTRAAIRRGDIPFFLRRGRSILDERGQAVVAVSHHPRLQNQATMEAGIRARLRGGVPASLDWVIERVQEQHNRLCTDLRTG